MSNCQEFQAFESRFGAQVAEDVLERICDAHWSSGKDKSASGVVLTGTHAHNACNHTLTGHFDHEGETFHFVVDNGDWAGTVVQEFGTSEEAGQYEPPAPAQYTFAPRDDALEHKRPAMYQVYLAWTQTSWFKEKLAAYHYDRHFQPGCVVEQQYSDWAASKGLKIVRVN